MKSYRRPGWYKSRVMACLVSLGIALFFAGTAQAGIQYEYRCEFCHTMPPLDSDNGKRLAPSGAVKGNHQSHAGSDAASCVKCHGPELTSTGHRDKLIQVTGAINGSPQGRYDRVFINQTTVPPNPLGTCSNVNCHFESPSPTWGRKPDYSVPAGCNDCHLMNRGTGNHTAHAAYYGSGTGACVKCHPDHGAEALPFRHATSAANRGIAVSFNATPNSGGSYSGDGLNYLPSQMKTSFGSCSAVYCHSDGAGNGPNTPATWGGQLPAGCTGCHGGNALSGKVIASGAHGKHINNANFTSGVNLGSDYRCARCHNGTVNISSDIAVTVAGKASHVDGNKDVSFSDGGSYSGGSCSATMCHSAGKPGLPAPAAVSWNGGALDCKGCHGAGSLYGEPNYASTGLAADLANSHGPKHVSGADSCVNCHATTTSDGVSIVNGATTHTDGAITVSFPGKYDLGSAKYDATVGVKKCTNTYCHSDGKNGPALETAQWGGQTNCRSCHGGDAASGKTIDSYRHAAHLSNYSSVGSGNALMCADCHAKTMGFGNNTTIVNPQKHLNRFKDYSGAKAGSFSGTVCSNVYCHSSGEAVPVFRSMTGSKAWDGSAKLSCNGCHGYGPGEFVPVAGEPNYPSGKGAENSHLKHVAGANMTDSRGCAICHRTTVDAGVKNRLRSYSSAHLNGVRDVSFGVIANYSGHYVPGNKSCANTYCHGAGNSAAWGTKGLGCDSCHGAGATVPGPTLAGAHAAHWQGGTNATSYVAAPGNQTGTATSYNFECSTCHSGAHAQGPSTNGNAAEVLFNYTSMGLKASYSYGTATAFDGTLQWSDGRCDNTYCHSNGNGGVGYGTAGMTWASPAGTLRCNGCHGGDYSAQNPVNPIDTNLHRAHLDSSRNQTLGEGNARKCGDCHALTVSYADNSTLTDKRRHVNKFTEYSGLLAGGSAKYDRSQKTCNDIYCHSNGKPRGSSVYQFRGLGAWTATTQLGCNGCHGNADSAEFQSDLMGTPNYASGPEGTDSANSHKGHIEKMGITTSNQCYVCHARTVDKYADRKFRPYSTTHISDGATHVTFGTMSTPRFKLMNPAAAKYTGKTCTTLVCHSNGKGTYVDVKWGASRNCGMCHPMNRLSRGHAFHVYTSADSSVTAYDNYTANRSTSGPLSRYNYGCANCHPVNNPSHGKGTVLIDLYPGSANVVGTLRHKNGSAITVGGVVPGTSGSGTTLRDNDLYCDNVYCHSNGYPTALVYAQVPGWYNGVFTGDRCANCHGNAPNSSIVGSASHYNSNWVSTNTAGGHVMGIHTNNITNAVNFTGLLSPGSTDPSSHGATASVTPTTISCNTCHYGVVTTSDNGGSAQCMSCHQTPQRLASIADKSQHVNGSVAVQFRPTRLLSKAQLNDPSFAQISSSFMQRFNGYKGATSYDASKIDLSVGSYDGNGGNCTTVCHFNKPIRWDNVPAATCSSCHSSL